MYAARACAGRQRIVSPTPPNGARAITAPAATLPPRLGRSDAARITGVASPPEVVALRAELPETSSAATPLDAANAPRCATRTHSRPLSHRHRHDLPPCAAATYQVRASRRRRIPRPPEPGRAGGCQITTRYRHTVTVTGYCDGVLARRGQSCAALALAGDDAS